VANVSAFPFNEWKSRNIETRNAETLKHRNAENKRRKETLKHRNAETLKHEKQKH
jgi:hypothetical protein